MVQTYDVEALPVTVLMDREGRIFARFTGFVSKSDERESARLVGVKHEAVL
jgi:hypothetical protein